MSMNIPRPFLFLMAAFAAAHPNDPDGIDRESTRLWREMGQDGEAPQCNWIPGPTEPESRGD